MTYEQEWKEAIYRLRALRELVGDELEKLDNLSARAEGQGFYENAFEHPFNSVNDCYELLTAAIDEIQTTLSRANEA
jgi:hypothetical protein